MAEYASCECVGCHIIIPMFQAMRVAEKSRSSGSFKVWVCSTCYENHRAKRRKQLITAGAVAAIPLLFVIGGKVVIDGKDTEDDQEQVASKSSAPESAYFALIAQAIPERAASVARTEVPPQRIASADGTIPLMPTVVRTEPPVPTDVRSEVPPERTASIPPKQSTSQPEDVKRVQDRLIELRYLDGVSDGRWGPKSRAALREFKTTNGLTPDDKWDDATYARLFSSRAVRAQNLSRGRVQ